MIFDVIRIRRSLYTCRTWFSVACGEGVVEKDRGTVRVALAAIEGIAGRLARDGIRYRRIGAAMVGRLRIWRCVLCRRYAGFELAIFLYNCSLALLHFWARTLEAQGGDDPLRLDCA